jgi:hypothetical protein
LAALLLQIGSVHGPIAGFGGKWYFFYHVRGPSPCERRVCMEALEYNDDGTIKPVAMGSRAVLSE